MDYFDLAVQAKRQKKFDLALEYYEKEIGQEGLSVSVLQAIAKIYYLKKQHDFSIDFYLAATHLSLYLDNEHYKRGDIGIKQALQQIPASTANQFPHPIGTLLLFDSNSPRHIAHALLDREETYRKIPEFRPYAEIYYSHILGDGSHDATLRKFNLSSRDQINFDEERYIGIGFKFLIDSIKWSQIDNPNVMDLYLK